MSRRPPSMSACGRPHYRFHVVLLLFLLVVDGTFVKIGANAIRLKSRLALMLASGSNQKSATELRERNGVKTRSRLAMSSPATDRSKKKCHPCSHLNDMEASTAGVGGDSAAALLAATSLLLPPSIAAAVSETAPRAAPPQAKDDLAIEEAMEAMYASFGALWAASTTTIPALQ
jgi:hypothetical protein